jgi:hydrogenase assembly chaperone HypC/HupF
MRVADRRRVMCITYPGLVVALDAAGAVVRMDRRMRRASTLVLPDVAVGDWVLVGAGAVLRRIDPADAAELTRALDAAVEATPPAPRMPHRVSDHRPDQPARGGRP